MHLAKYAKYDDHAFTALNTARNMLRHEQNRRRRQGVWADRVARAVRGAVPGSACSRVPARA